MSGTSFTVEEATIDGIHAAMLASTSCSALVEAYLQRIDAFDRNGPKLNTIVSLSDQAQRRAGDSMGSWPRPGDCPARCTAYRCWSRTA